MIGHSPPPPVATGAEVNTGTDDTKIVSAKALADSTYVKPLVTSLSTTGGITTLTTAQNKSTMFEVTGTLTSNATVIVADTMGIFLVENLTTGGYTLTFKTSAGLGIVIPQGEIYVLTADGVDVDAVTATGSAGREVLTANRTYYVSTSGSDSNTGLTSGTAFLTKQKAIDVILGTLDLSIYDCTVQLADGTYTGGIIISAPFIGTGHVYIRGNATTPTNVIVSTSGNSFYITSNATIYLYDFKVMSSAGDCLRAETGGTIYFSGLDFGTTLYRHMQATVFGVIQAVGNYTISGGAWYHVRGITSGNITIQNRTITLSGTPAFAVAFADASVGASLSNTGNTYAGTGATGVRYSAVSNSVIFTSGGGANYFPGNAAGSTATGGQYV